MEPHQIIRRNPASGTIAATTIDGACARDRIAEKTRAVVHGYWASREYWNTAPSLSALLRQMRREYEGRFLYELIQNAYDAHPAGSAGEIVVLLDPEEGTHGVLYVGNSGTPFTDSNFEAICELAQSDKTPDESVGNKGIGFKSVLQVCEWPEIYSAAGALGGGRFDGYCFSFARPEQYLDLAAGDAELAAELQRDISPYFLPVPVDEQPPRVAELAQRGLVTVIRLPLRDDAARDTVIERVDRFLDEDVPVQLFLDRLQELEIERAGEPPRRLVRESRAVVDPAGDADQRYEHVDLGWQGRWFITSRRMLAKAMREAIEESELEESWASWDHDAWVSVAVRIDGSEIRPRLYTFLPMEREATAPLHAHVHAPFSTKLARTSVSEQIILNTRLLDCAARASMMAVLAFRDEPATLPAVALVDLLSWDSEHHERVTRSFADAGIAMDELEVVPIEPLPDGRLRGAFKFTYLWPYPALTLFNHERLAKDAAAELVSREIDGDRLARLEKYCERFFPSVGFRPDAQARAGWVEAVAGRLHARKARPRTWDRLYAELVQLFEGEAAELRGRKILLGDDGGLHAAPPDDSDEHPLVFFPASRVRTDEEDEVEADVDLKPPATLGKVLVRMSDELTWTRQDGRRRPRQTEARRFLEESKLVRRFRTLDLLEHMGRAVAGSRRATLLRDTLRFTFQLSLAARSTRAEDLRAVELRVPTKSGWKPATDAIFPPQWQTPLAASLGQLVERAQGYSQELSAVADQFLLTPEEWPCKVENLGAWRDFLAEIGVRDGLWPRREALSERAGSEVDPRSIAQRLPLDATGSASWVDAVRASPAWAPDHPYTPYRPRAALAFLPGQVDYEHLDPRSRMLFAELVVAGLNEWPDDALRLIWHRHKHPRDPDELVWPSPLAAFLGSAAWLPVTDPQRAGEPGFEVPRHAWYFDDARGEEVPFFSPLVLGGLRRLASERAIVRLKALGLGDWTDRAHAVRLLFYLAGLVERDELPETGMLVFRRAYEDAWLRVASIDPARVAGEVEDLPVVITRQDALAVRRPSDGQAPLYLLTDKNSLTGRLLEAAELDILNIREREPAVLGLLRGLFGARLIAEDDLQIDIVTDGKPFVPDGSGALILDGEGRWLETLVGVVLETKRTRAGPLGPRRRQEVRERLRRVRLVETQRLELRIAGAAAGLDESHHQVVPVFDQDHPTLVVAGYASDLLSQLIRVVRPLCELLDIVYYADPLLLVLERLRAAGITSPTDEDYARTLEIDPARVAEVRSHLGSSVDSMLRLLTPLAYHADAEAALALLDGRHELEQEADVQRAIAAYVPDAVRAVELSRDDPSPAAFRDALGLDYCRFNAALAALSFPPIVNPEGHAHALEHYLQTHRSSILHELRSRHYESFRSGKPLDAYLAARKLVLEPDEAWLMEYDVPPSEVLSAHVQRWMEGQGSPAAPEQELPDVDQVRAENRKRLTDLIERAARLVPAWVRKHRTPLPAVWTDGEVAERLLAAAVDAGQLDFVPLSEQDLFAWLMRSGAWPPGMAMTLSATELGLSEDDLRSEAEVHERERRERLRRQRVLSFGEVELAAEPAGYPAIFEHVSGSLRDDLLAPRRSAPLEEVTAAKAGGGGHGRGSGYRRAEEGLSEMQRAAVGLVGETVAYAWLMRQYPEVCSPESWVSSYCEAIGQPRGDDSLGYDFRIALSSRTLYFEVKATMGTDTRFALGESEVRKAAECARRRHDDYRVLFITNALDAQARQMHVLRNPLDPKNETLYAFPGAGLLCTFRLA